MQSLHEVRAEAQRLGHTLAELEGQKKLLASQLGEASSRRESAEHDYAARDTSLEVLRGLEAAWQKKGNERIGALVSHGLTAVFGEPITLTVGTETKRDTTQMYFELEQDGVKIRDIVGGTGGSIVSLLSTLLRVVTTLNLDVSLARVLVADEPFGAVEERYLPAIGDLLKELSERLGFQFVVASHEPELIDAADVVHEVTKRDGVATVKQIKGATG